MRPVLNPWVGKIPTLGRENEEQTLKKIHLRMVLHILQSNQRKQNSYQIMQKIICFMKNKQNVNYELKLYFDMPLVGFPVGSDRLQNLSAM